MEKAVGAKDSIYGTLAYAAMSGYTSARVKLEPVQIKELEFKGFKIFDRKKEGYSSALSCEVRWDNPSLKDSLAVDMLKMAIQRLIQNYEAITE
ncbi:MAG: hypothetical protein IJ217_00885 [Clostridia bacterium]|nr:hypothetical protein [Clostridia bacterium]